MEFERSMPTNPAQRFWLDDRILKTPASKLSPDQVSELQRVISNVLSAGKDWVERDRVIDQAMEDQERK